jgi:sodium/potassium-transporting ATPase subunit alpha
MHVEDVAILDTTFTPKSLRENLVTASPEVRENIAQLGAISAVCNAAVMVLPTPEKSHSGNGEILGDATGIRNC